MRYAICDMAAFRDFVTSGVQICDNQSSLQLRFFPCGASTFAKNRRMAWKLWSMEDVFAVLSTCFGKSWIFQLFPRVMYQWMENPAPSEDLWTTMMVCLALAAIMKYQVEQHRRCSFADRNWQRSRKELEIARLCVRDICTFAVLFWYIDLSLCRVWHQSVIFHTVFILCLGSYCKVFFIVSKYWLSRDKVWNIPRTCFKVRLTTEKHKPPVMLRVSVGSP